MHNFHISENYLVYSGVFIKVFERVEFVASASEHALSPSAAYEFSVDSSIFKSVDRIPTYNWNFKISSLLRKIY